MKYNLHYVLRKVVAYYKRKHINANNEFLVMILNCYHFYKQNTNLQRIGTLRKTHIYSKMINKKTSHVLEEL
jgi:hypothetical protein